MRCKTWPPALTGRGLVFLVLLVLGACTSPPAAPPSVAPKPAVHVALVLGGGAARGFAHVGVIKMLESQGVRPEIVVGSSVGSLVGALYAAGYSGYDLQRLVLQLGQFDFVDLALPDRGFIKGQKLQDFVNTKVGKRPIEALPMRFVAVATDAGTGQRVDFTHGNTGQAVRASASVPGVFQPVLVQGHRYIDGGVSSPVPVRAARKAGANFVIAVDILPDRVKTLNSSLAMLNQSVRVMNRQQADEELAQADVVIRPAVGGFGLIDFGHKHEAVMEGERAALAAMPAIRAGLARFAAQAGR